MGTHCSTSLLREISTSPVGWQDTAKRIRSFISKWEWEAALVIVMRRLMVPPRRCRRMHPLIPLSLDPFLLLLLLLFFPFSFSFPFPPFFYTYTSNYTIYPPSVLFLLMYSCIHSHLICYEIKCKRKMPF